MSTTAVARYPVAVRTSRLEAPHGRLHEGDGPRSAVSGVEIGTDGAAAVGGVRAASVANKRPTWLRVLWPDLPHVPVEL
jgi:hypothetical protein